MQVSPIGFKGLWRGPVTVTKGGKDPRCEKGGTVCRVSYEYLPFKDETEQQIVDTAMKYNSTIYAYRDKRDEDYDEDNPEFYFIPSVMIGEKLNITADEYNKISQLEPTILDTDNVDEYRPLRKDEALELLDLVDKFGKKNNQ